MHDHAWNRASNSTLTVDDDSCQLPPLTEVELREDAISVIGCVDDLGGGADKETGGTDFWCTSEASIATVFATGAEPVVSVSGSHDADVYRLAVTLTERGEYEDALAVAEDRLASLTGHQVGASVITPLWMLKATVLGLMGRHRESLQCYQSLVAAADKPANSEVLVMNRADRANILYACGRLCLALKDCGMAIDYYTQELEVTVDLVGSDCHPSVSRIHHQIAHVYKECLGELDLSLRHLSKALQVELAYLEQLKASCRSCANSRANGNTACCPTHTEALRGALQQVRQTKLQLGRTHFELGDLNQAIRLTLH